MTKPEIWIFEYLDTASESSHKSMELLSGELADRGVHTRIMDPRDLDILASPEGVVFRHEGKEIPLPACVLPRNGSSSDERLYILLNTLVRLNVPVINRPEAIQISTNKSATMMALAAAGLGIPKTALPAIGADAGSITASLGEPVIVKRVCASKGEGVFLFSDKKNLRNFLNHADGTGTRGDLVFQEFVATSAGHDARVIVMDGKVVRSFARNSSSSEEFRANLALGGYAGPYPVPPKVEKLCLAAAEVSGLDIVGIDILFGANDTYMICEMNSAPHLDAEILNDEKAGRPAFKFVADVVLSRIEGKAGGSGLKARRA